MRLIRAIFAVMCAFVMPIVLIRFDFGRGNERATILYVLWFLASVAVVTYLAKLKARVPLQAILVPTPILFALVGYLLGSLCRRNFAGLQLGVFVGFGTILTLIVLVRGRVKVHDTLS